jgi:hypothetical protein
MGANYAVIEVKPVSVANAGLRKDLRTLKAFRGNGEYVRALLLLYGNAADIRPLLRRVQELADRDDEGNIDLDGIEIWWHPVVGQSAGRVR